MATTNSECHLKHQKFMAEEYLVIHKEFIVDDFGEIINPRRMSYKHKKYMVYTNQAKLPCGKWAYGWGYELQDEIKVSPITLDSNYVLFDTEKEAFQYALRFLLMIVENQNADKKYDLLLMVMREDVKEIKFPLQQVPKYTQLSLF